jgi:hypothetical protein
LCLTRSSAFAHSSRRVGRVALNPGRRPCQRRASGRAGGGDADA